MGEAGEAGWSETIELAPIRITTKGGHVMVPQAGAAGVWLCSRCGLVAPERDGILWWALNEPLDEIRKGCPGADFEPMARMLLRTDPPRKRDGSLVEDWRVIVGVVSILILYGMLLLFLAR